MLNTDMMRPRMPAVRTRPFAPPQPVMRVTAPATISTPNSSDQKSLKTTRLPPVENRKFCDVPKPPLDIIDQPVTPLPEIHEKNVEIITRTPDLSLIHISEPTRL